MNKVGIRLIKEDDLKSDDFLLVEDRKYLSSTIVDEVKWIESGIKEMK